MVRHDDAVCAGGNRFARIGLVQHALQDQRSLPDAAHPLEILPGHARIKRRGRPVQQGPERVGTLHHAGQVAERERPPPDADIMDPPRLRGKVRGHAQARKQRQLHAHAIADVAIARAQHRKVDGEDQRPAIGCRRARDDLLHHAPVPHHVELEPEGLAGRPAHLLDRADADGRQREGNAGLLRSLRSLDFRPPRHHPGKAHGGQHDRERQLLAEQRHRRVQRRHVAKHFLLQRDLLQVGAVGKQRRLVERTAVDIVEHQLRQAPSGQFAIVRDRSGCEHGQDPSCQSHFAG